MDDLSSLFVAMETQDTRLLGIAHCIVPKEQLPVDPPPVFVAPPITLLPANILNTPIPAISKAILGSKPGIVQLIIPIATETTAAPSTTTDTPITSTTIETTPQTISSKIIIIDTTTVPTPLSTTFGRMEADITVATPKEDVNNISAEQSTESSNSTEPMMPGLLATNMHSNDINIDDKYRGEPEIVLESTTPSTKTIPSVTETNEPTTRTIVITTSTFSSTQPVLQTVESSTVSTSTPVTVEVMTTTPLSVAQIILRQPETISMAPEQDNYVYETFSSVPEVIGPMDERAQQLVLVEEPPESLTNDAAPAA